MAQHLWKTVLGLSCQAFLFFFWVLFLPQNFVLRAHVTHFFNILHVWKVHYFISAQLDSLCTSPHLSQRCAELLRSHYWCLSIGALLNKLISAKHSRASFEKAFEPFFTPIWWSKVLTNLTIVSTYCYDACTLLEEFCWTAQVSRCFQRDAH